MQLSLQNFSSLMEGMAASVQGAASSLVDLTVGSVLRAILEANAAVALWLQWLIVEVLSATRLATSSGADCDSFGADFGFTRLPAVASSGEVTFSRFSAASTALVPVGASVATAGNTQSFVVVADTSNAAYNAASDGYVITAGVSNVNATVVASVSGAAGNVLPGMISLLSSAIPGIDTVTNASALTGGVNAEGDAAFKARFSNYLASLSRATNISIGSAIEAIQQGLSYSITENQDQTGAVLMGHFVVTVDDGTGAPPATLLQTVQQTVDAIRPVGTSFAVQGPIVVSANISVTLVTATGTNHAIATTAVAGAWATYIATLPIGMTLSYTKLAQLAYEASSSIVNLSDLALNGGTADLVPPLFGVVRAGVVTVS
jgi:uncharacterized phage protein gp47/JayE